MAIATSRACPEGVDPVCAPERRHHDLLPVQPGPALARATLTADALALRTTFDAAAAGNLRARVALHLGADRFVAEIAEGRFRIARGDTVDPDAVLTADAGGLQGTVFGGADLPAGAVTGDRAVAERFVGLFPRPAPRAVA